MIPAGFVLENKRNSQPCMRVGINYLSHNVRVTSHHKTLTFISILFDITSGHALIRIKSRLPPRRWCLVAIEKRLSVTNRKYVICHWQPANLMFSYGDMVLLCLPQNYLNTQIFFNLFQRSVYCCLLFHFYIIFNACSGIRKGIFTLKAIKYWASQHEKKK